MEMIEDVISGRARSTSVESGATPNVLSDSGLLNPPGMRSD